MSFLFTILAQSPISTSFSLLLKSSFKGAFYHSGHDECGDGQTLIGGVDDNDEDDGDDDGDDDGNHEDDGDDDGDDCDDYVGQGKHSDRSLLWFGRAETSKLHRGDHHHIIIIIMT